MPLTAKPKKGLRLGHAFAAVAAGFALLGLWPWLMPVAAPPAAAKPSPHEPVASLPELAPIGSFPAIVERPLFSPSRRPAAAKPAAPIAGPELRYRLVGVLIVGENRRAMLRDGSRSFEISEGDKLEQWVVQRIETNRLLLSSAAGETELKLRQSATEGEPNAAPAPASSAR